jgi:hypothetical protein
MSLPETPTGAADTQALADVRRALDSLRTMFHLAALCGIVLSAVIYAFLYKEVKGLSRQNEDLRAYVQDFDANMAPKIRMAETNLAVFARTNPSFAPLFRKYFSTNAPAPAKRP